MIPHLSELSCPGVHTFCHMIIDIEVIPPTLSHSHTSYWSDNLAVCQSCNSQRGSSLKLRSLNSIEGSMRIAKIYITPWLTWRPVAPHKKNIFLFRFIAHEGLCPKVHLLLQDLHNTFHALASVQRVYASVNLFPHTRKDDEQVGCSVASNRWTRWDFECTYHLSSAGTRARYRFTFGGGSTTSESSEDSPSSESLEGSVDEVSLTSKWGSSNSPETFMFSISATGSLVSSSHDSTLTTWSLPPPWITGKFSASTVSGRVLLKNSERGLSGTNLWSWMASITVCNSATGEQVKSLE